MKKIAFITAILVLSTTLLAGCGKFTCEACEEEKSGKKYNVNVLGQEMTICKDCNEEWEAGKKELKELYGIDVDELDAEELGIDLDDFKGN